MNRQEIIKRHLNVWVPYSPYTLEHEESERAEMCRWLDLHEIRPRNRRDSESLMQEILRAGGDPDTCMAKGRLKVNREKLKNSKRA